MKTIIRFVLLLTIGALLGYVFHNTIDSYLKSKLGEPFVEKLNHETKRVTEKTVEVGKAAFDAGKEKYDSSKSE